MSDFKPQLATAEKALLDLEEYFDQMIQATSRAVQIARDEENHTLVVATRMAEYSYTHAKEMVHTFRKEIGLTK
jgi:uncharacterized damage-inducible protein DinB